jgi:hypothetical protein
MILQPGFINVPSGVGRAAWVECFEATAERAPIFGMCEIHTRAAKKTMLTQARRYGLSQHGLFKGPDPIFWDTSRYRRIHANHYRLHGARASRWVGFNAARYANVVVLRPRKDDGPDVTVICTHWVPRGPKVAAWWRTKARKRSRDKVAHLVAAHAARGRVVVVMGDFNMDTPPRLPEMTWLVGVRHGVDKIGVTVPRGWRIKARTADRFRAPTDHRFGVSAEVEIERIN